MFITLIINVFETSMTWFHGRKISFSFLHDDSFYMTSSFFYATLPFATKFLLQHVLQLLVNIVFKQTILNGFHLGYCILYMGIPNGFHGGWELIEIFKVNIIVSQGNQMTLSMMVTNSLVIKVFYSVSRLM